MARPARNNIDYFPHPVNDGKKMFFIESKYGNNGYSTWYKILEQLGKNNYHYIDLRDEAQIMYLSAQCKISEDLLKNIINDLVKLNEFHKELWEKYNILFNQKFIDSITDAYNKRNNNCITLIGLLELLQVKLTPKPQKSKLKAGINPQRKVEDSKEEESKEKVTKNHSFKNSIYFDFELLKKDIGEKYQKYDLKDYHESMINYSASRGKKYIDWLATCRSWINRDIKELKNKKNGKGKNNGIHRKNRQEPGELSRRN